MIPPKLITRLGHFGARVDGSIKLSIFSMQCGCLGHWGHCGYLCQGYCSVCKVQAVSGFFEAKNAVEVIEASDVITSGDVTEATDGFTTTQALEIDKLLARITSFWKTNKLKALNNFFIHQNLFKYWLSLLHFATDDPVDILNWFQHHLL